MCGVVALLIVLLVACFFSRTLSVSPWDDESLLNLKNEQETWSKVNLIGSVFFTSLFALDSGFLAIGMPSCVCATWFGFRKWNEGHLASSELRFRMMKRLVETTILVTTGEKQFAVKWLK
jgi:hypothetical protein